MKKTLVVGASGATGKLLVQQLLQSEIEVVAIVRDSNSFNQAIGNHPKLHIVEASIAEMSEDMLFPLLEDCDAVFSCLGHNLSFKGLFGKPRRLVTDTVSKIVRVIESINPAEKVKFILMNTTGNTNLDEHEKPPLSQKIIVFVLRVLLPPHVDNEQAADVLRLNVGKFHTCIEWAAVRPDALTDADSVTAYDVHPSPIRNPIFDAGTTSRINVADFMCKLAITPDLWSSWKGRMPVIYNKV